MRALLVIVLHMQIWDFTVKSSIFKLLL